MRKPYLKQVIVINGDLGMTAGKAASQACHASAGAVYDATYRKTRHSRHVSRWMEAPTKIVLEGTTREMQGVIKRCKNRHIPVFVFVDSAPTTQNTEGKMTALAIGPMMSNEFDELTAHLPMMD